MTGTISSPGIGSGLDVQSIVSQLMVLEKAPIDDIEKKTTAVKTQLSAYGKLNAAVAAFRDASMAVTKSDTWTTTTSTSSDATSVSVTSGTAAPGSYAVAASQLAAAQSLSGGVVANASALGTGTLHIELGQFSTDQSTFTPKSGATAVDVVIGTGEDSLSSIADKINKASAGVTASIVTDLSGSRLVLRSSATGKENGFRITSTGAPGSALANVAFDPSTGVTGMTKTQTAQNALASVNGLAIESASNTIEGAVAGLAIKLNKVTTSPVDITVDQDDDAIKTKLQAFADSYNALNTLMKEQLKYDAGTKEAGPLQGDRTAVALQVSLRQMLGSNSGASSKYTRLSDIGMEIQKDGSLLVNTTKLTAALDTAPAEMRKMFANVDSSTPIVPTNDGLGQRLRALGDAVLGVEGSISMRSSGLQDQINRNSKREDDLKERATRTEARLKAQYNTLDTKLASLNGLSQYVTNQLTALAK